MSPEMTEKPLPLPLPKSPSTEFGAFLITTQSSLARSLNSPSERLSKVTATKPHLTDLGPNGQTATQLRWQLGRGSILRQNPELKRGILVKARRQRLPLCAGR